MVAFFLQQKITLYKKRIFTSIKAKKTVTYNFSKQNYYKFMTTTEQIKGIVERLGALRRYL